MKRDFVRCFHFDIILKLEKVNFRNAPKKHFAVSTKSFD